jgi:Flp pilus assembly protein TadG
VVELAIVIPMFVVLILGIVEFTLAFNMKQAVYAAAREGARVAAIGESSGQVQTRTLDALDFVPTSVAITSCISHPSDKTARVTVVANRAINIPIIGWSYTVVLTGKAAFRCEVT